jgi:hypothetical protein
MISLAVFGIGVCLAVWGFRTVNKTGNAESFAGGCLVYGSLTAICVPIGWFIAFLICG